MGRGCIFRIPARGGAQPFAAPSLPFFPAVAQCRSRARRRKRFLLQLQHSTQPASKARRMAAMGGFAVFRIQNCGAKPLCAAGQDGLRATAKKISCRLPAASGHFASQNRACLRQGSACPLHAGILLRKAAPVSGRGLPARCKRAFCLAKPRLPPAGAACPPQAGILLRKAAPVSGRGLPARCMRAFCFAKPRLPAASGHFASQNRACLRQGPACPLHAGILLRKAAPASGRGLPARCMRAFCFAKPRLPPAGVCLPAACGHFASQNRRTPYFQKINAAVYVEPPSGEKAPLHGPGQGGSSLFLICC